jgi:hypothetical protein
MEHPGHDAGWLRHGLVSEAQLLISGVYSVAGLGTGLDMSAC